MKHCSSDSFAIASLAGRWWWVALAAVAWVVCGCDPRPHDSRVISLEHAERTFVQEGEAATAEERSLPDAWSCAERAHYAAARYGADFSLAEAPAEPWAVYLPRVDMNAAIAINGTPIGSLGRLEPPISRMRHRPLLYEIPTSLLHAGKNRIEVLLAVEATSAGSLSRIEIGPKRRLTPIRAVKHFFQISLIQIAVFAAVVLILVVATVYGPRGRGSSYRWFQVSIACWIVYASEVWWIDPPSSARTVEAIANGAQYLSIWCIMLGFHRALEGPRRRIELGVLAGITLAIACLLLIPAHLVWPARAVLGVAICGVAGYMVQFVRGASAAQDWVLKKHHAAGGLFGLAAGVHDIASAPFGVPYAGTWLTPHAGAVAIFLTLAAILRHLVVSIRESNALGHDLEERVALREHELALYYERLRAYERRQLLEAERKRLTHGLHSGVGSVLVSTIAGVESRSEPISLVADRIRDALDDLRLVIDSLRPEESLIDILARLRSRLMARFERHGIEVAWQVEDIPPLRGFGAEHALYLLRILQDVLRAAERRPGVGVVTVRTGRQTLAACEGIFVEIEDDCEIAEPRIDASEMRERLEAIGANLSLDAGATGTRVRIWLPVDLDDGKLR